MKKVLVYIVILFLSGCVSQPREGSINSSIQNAYLSSVYISDCEGNKYGSGTIIYNEINERLVVLTAAHVLEDNTKVCAHPIFDGKMRRMERYKVDAKVDLALILGTSKEKKHGPSVRISTHSPSIGDAVVSIGFPSVEDGVVTSGIISGFEVIDGNMMYRSNSESYYGSSGGGAFNYDGELIGVSCIVRRYMPYEYREIIPGGFFSTGLEVIRKFM